MVLPLFKVLSLFIRVFARPISNKTKKYHVSNAQNGHAHNYSRRFYVFLGNYYNRLETRINRSFLRIETKDDFFVKPLSDEQAIEKGVEFFYEIIIYSILFGLPMYEMWRTSNEGAEKTNQLNSQLASMDQSLKDINTQLSLDTEVLNSQKIKNEELRQQVLSIQELLSINFSQFTQDIQDLQTSLVRIKEVNSHPKQK